jgi:hypothetical protein
MTQEIRKSQFVITYGPGSILETVDGPRIIPKSDIGLFNHLHIDPKDYRIDDDRMSKGLLDGNGVYELPSSAALGSTKNWDWYRTKAFPEWKLCLNATRHPKGLYILYQSYYSNGCPECKEYNRSESIRFVSACSDGHLDEFNWEEFAHKPNKSCGNKSIYHWSGGGGALSQIYIKCPDCNAESKSLSEAYADYWTCSGRNPECEDVNGPPIRPHGCSSPARLIQRQASNLRMTELDTLFSIPPIVTQLHSDLGTSEMKAALSGLEVLPKNKKDLESMLGRLVERDVINESVRIRILSNPWNEIKRAIDDIFSTKNDEETYSNLLEEEFFALVKASKDGQPPVRGEYPKSPVFFEVSPNDVEFAKMNEKIRLRITPVKKLRTIIVQKGYRRNIGRGKSRSTSPESDTPSFVDVSFEYNKKKWYPGVQFLGEGLFLTFDEKTEMAFNGEVGQAWANADKDLYSNTYHNSGDRREIDPLFVWWHTLSHLLIRRISQDAGYSSASIRERVYFTNRDKLRQGGIILYVTQPGTDGTLGGLISLAKNIQIIIDEAIEEAGNCSADPLCSENLFENGKYSGAACYSCLYLSETSCEKRNMWLDRNLIRETLHE